MQDMPSSKTKGFFCGGGPTRVNIIENITFASLGNAVDFGDMTGAYYRTSGRASNTRAFIGSIRTTSMTNQIDFFDGSINERRETILEKMRLKEINVKRVFGVYRK